MNWLRWLVLLMVAALGCAPSEAWKLELGGEKPRRPRREREARRWKVPTEKPPAQRPPEQRPAERTGNVTITVEKILLGRQERVNLDSAWRYADEHVLVRGGRLARRNGIRIGVATDGFSAAVQAALSKSRNKEVQKLSITTLTGHTASISVGRDTYFEALRYWTPLGGTVLLERVFVGSSLVVEPTILPEDRVRVRLYPRFTTREGRAIDVAELATEVVLRNRQSMVLAQLDESSENVGYALFSWGRARESRQVTIILTPTIEGAP